MGIVLFGAVYSCSPTKPVVSKQNVAANYQPTADIGISADHLMQHDSMLVWLRFGNRDLFKGRLPSDLVLQIRVSPTYESTEPVYLDSVWLQENQVQWQADKAVFRLGIPRAQLVQNGVLSLTLIDRVGEQKNSFDLPLTTGALDKQYVVLESNSALPLFRHFANPTDSFRIVAAEPNVTVKATRYKADFPAALPPMSLSAKKVAPTIPVLDSAELPTLVPFALTKPGLYAVQPSQGSGGIMLVEEDGYPELTTARDLIEPLLYITTSKERNALYQSVDPKKAVDQFWLDIGGTEGFARTLIKSYYSRVTDANQLFTSHKQGWKTDRGMIYIVMGRPTAVHRYADREEWTYAAGKDQPTTEFVFYRKEHTLTKNHYELLRNPVFEPVWYRAAEKWRKGITDL